MKKANLLLAAGGVLLVIGLVVIAVLARDDGNDTRDRNEAGGGRTRTVLVATTDIDAGTNGKAAAADGWFEEVTRPAGDVPAGAIDGIDDIGDAALATDVAEGDIITSEHLEGTRRPVGALSIPEGLQAVAVTVDSTAGGAGYIGAGDRVNVFVNIQPQAEGAPVRPLTKLILSDVEVLDVSAQIDRGSQDDSDDESRSVSIPTELTLVLALDASQAEQAIFATNQNSLWFALVPDDQGRSETDGVTYDSGLIPEPGER